MNTIIKKINKNSNLANSDCFTYFAIFFFTKTSAIDFLTSPLILVSLLIALCFPLILMWAKRVNKKKL